MTGQKPTLHLLSGKKIFDLDALVTLYRALTGREPTESELQEVRVMLEEAKRERADRSPAKSE